MHSHTDVSALSRDGTGKQLALSREREHELARLWRQHRHLAARERLVLSQLHHVVAIARKYRRRGGASLEELIAEGNFGLVRALDTFDPERGTRLVTYAVHWIRAYIAQYLVRAKSVVTAGLHSKIMAKVRRKRDQILRAQGDVWDLNEQISAQLGVSPARLNSLLERLDAHDQAWDPGAEQALGAFGAHEPHWSNPEETMLHAERQSRLCAVLWQIVATLDDRERYIVQRRLMAHREEVLSLSEIGRHFGFSRERARQLEARAIRKIKNRFVRAQNSGDELNHHDAA